MHCIVTAGPTYEKLDDVRRLTNFSTGRLGMELAVYLKSRNHRTTLLVGEQATWPGERTADQVHQFSTTNDLLRLIESVADESVGAVFHAAAVSDFTFGQVFERNSDGKLLELTDRKVSTRAGTLLAELVPTPKIIAELPRLFPKAFLVGWKYEADGTREDVLSKAVRQIRENGTTACVANGPAYGGGFGIVNGCGTCDHAIDRRSLYEKLVERLPS